MKWSYMTWHVWACGLHFKWKSDIGSPEAKEGSAHWTNPSTVRQPQSSHWLTRSLKVNNSKSKQESVRKVGITNIISDHPALNLGRIVPAIPPVPVIPIIPALVIQSYVRQKHPAEATMPICNQQCGFERQSRKAVRQSCNVLPAAAEIT